MNLFTSFLIPSVLLRVRSSASPYISQHILVFCEQIWVKYNLFVESRYVVSLLCLLTLSFMQSPSHILIQRAQYCWHTILFTMHLFQLVALILCFLLYRSPSILSTPSFLLFAKTSVLFILYLHRALNKVTQSANQHMHTFNFFIH